MLKTAFRMAGEGLEVVDRLEKRINELRKEIGEGEKQWVIYDEAGKDESAHYCRMRIDEAHELLSELERIMNG